MFLKQPLRSRPRTACFLLRHSLFPSESNEHVSEVQSDFSQESFKYMGSPIIPPSLQFCKCAVIINRETSLLFHPSNRPRWSLNQPPHKRSALFSSYSNSLLFTQRLLSQLPAWPDRICLTFPHPSFRCSFCVYSEGRKAISRRSDGLLCPNVTHLDARRWQVLESKSSGTAHPCRDNRNPTECTPKGEEVSDFS